MLCRVAAVLALLSGEKDQQVSCNIAWQHSAEPIAYAMHMTDYRAAGCSTPAVGNLEG